MGTRGISKMSEFLKFPLNMSSVEPEVRSSPPISSTILNWNEVSEFAQLPCSSVRRARNQIRADFAAQVARAQEIADGQADAQRVKSRSDGPAHRRRRRILTTTLPP